MALKDMFEITRTHQTLEEFERTVPQAYGIAADFSESRKDLAEHEGGNDDDPQDPGGRTSRGIIQSEYDRYRARNGRPARDVWKADDAEVDEIYRTEYWEAMRCDELPAGLDYCVFDYGVNSGISRSAKVLQKVLGVTIDGRIGLETIKVASAMAAPARINAMCDERLAFLQRLSTWPRFGRGWATRVADVRKASLAMALKVPASKAPVVVTNSFISFLNAILALFKPKART